MSVWEDCPTIEAIPGKCAGRWGFAETRMPVYMLFGHLAAGGGLDEFCADFGMNGAEREKVNGVAGTFIQSAGRRATARPVPE